MANTYLSRNQTGNTYTRTWTLSWWFKRSKLGTVQRMWTSDDDASGNNDDFFQWQTDDSIQFGFYASGYYAKMHTNRKQKIKNARTLVMRTRSRAQSCKLYIDHTMKKKLRKYKRKNTIREP